jgi:hypothetical protein
MEPLTVVGALEAQSLNEHRRTAIIFSYLFTFALCEIARPLETWCHDESIQLS